MSDDEAWTAGSDALCVSLLRPLSPVEAANAIALTDFRSIPDRETAETWVTESDNYDRSWFATGEVEDWTFVWETNGWQGVTTENTDRLAGAGVLVSMFWNVNSVMTFLVVENGRVTRQFDPLSHDDDVPSTVEVGSRLASEAGLDWEGSPRTSGLSLLATLAGGAPVLPSGSRHPASDSGVTGSDQAVPGPPGSAAIRSPCKARQTAAYVDVVSREVYGSSVRCRGWS